MCQNCGGEEDGIMRLEKEIEALRPELIHAVQECIKIPSVKNLSDLTLNAPFGADIKRALDWTLELGKELGFTVRNIDGYVGEIELGQGEPIGILGHLDVVPEGEGWTVPPYGGVIQDGKIFGRGALDDKGPTLAALFAMKAIKDAELPLNKTIRLILGTDEESGWADMDYYLERRQIPEIGFAPDAAFPLIHAEKGILHLEMTADYSFPHLVYISGGERANVVPDRCRIILKDITSEQVTAQLEQFSLPSAVNITWNELDNGDLDIVVRGVGAHGSLPEKGFNAALYGLRFLATLPLANEEITVLNWLVEHLGQGFNGEGLNLEYEDTPSGKLSHNLGVVNLGAGKLQLIVDVRYPVTYHVEDILGPVEKLAQELSLAVQVVTHQKAHHVPKESPLVQSLLRAYSDVTGLDGFAFAIGGGTYAKVLPQGVAFGPVLPGDPEVIHCADEYISIDNLLLTTKVYAEAILNLALDEEKV